MLVRPSPRGGSQGYLAIRVETGTLPVANTATFTLSASPGSKTLYAEYRGSAGNTLVVALPQPILYAPNVPTIALTAPAANAVLALSPTITATASDALGVTQVAFFIDDVLLSQHGVTDLDRYSVTPGTTDFIPDFFVD